MTEKLYYTDAYIKEFTAGVISCESKDGYYEVVLDRTAFFPEEGGQSADRGVIGGVRVNGAFERNGIVYHCLDGALSVGDTVACVLDFDERFDKMQQHTAEHIVCGIIHKMFGFNNVGFHLGADDVTLDIDGELNRSQLDEVETLANQAVFNNLSVTAYFPSPEELESLSYRSKLALTEGIRIVNIGDVDSCACCAPHVSRTGEVGMIKLLDFLRWKGGLRIHMAAGKRALIDYREKYESVKKISALLSAPKEDVAEEVDNVLSDLESLHTYNKQLLLRIASLEAERISPTERNCVHIIPDMPIEGLIEFSNKCRDKVGGYLVAISGTDGDYKYVISSNKYNLKESAAIINAALNGRGGGRPGMIQGSIKATASEVKEYFK